VRSATDPKGTFRLSAQVFSLGLVSVLPRSADETEVLRAPNRLGASLDAELGENVLHVGLDGFWHDAQRACDFLVRSPLPISSRMLRFSCAQRIDWHWAFLWTLLTAALSLIVGVLLLWHPAEGAVSLTLVLTAFFIVEGIFRIAASISYRDAFPSSWGWMLASGIADLILGLIAGVNLITSGWAVIMVALVKRSAVKTLVSGSR
jgi:hypothetical protein